jgi:hypothetical protein
LRDVVVDFVHLVRGDFHFLRLGFLDLQRLVDQVAQNLQAQALELIVRRLPRVVGGQNQSHTLFNVAAGDDLAVDDRRRTSLSEIVVPQNRDVVRNREGVDRTRLLLLPFLAIRRHGARAGEQRRDTKHPKSAEKPASRVHSCRPAPSALERLAALPCGGLTLAEPGG